MDVCPCSGGDPREVVTPGVVGGKSLGDRKETEKQKARKPKLFKNIAIYLFCSSKLPALLTLSAA